MLIDLVIFPLFLCALYVLGAGVLRLRVDTINSEDYPVYFYIIAALLFIGCTAVAVHFFIGVNSPVYFAVVGVTLLLGALRLRATDKQVLKPVLLLSLALIPMAAQLPAGSDAGLYHIPQQLLLREEKIIFGFANIHSRYGFSSMLEYIASALWIGENFKLISYMQAGVMLVFILFLWDLMKSRNTQIAVVGWLTGLGVLSYSVHFNFGYTSTDVASGILFAMAFLYGLCVLLQSDPVSKKQLVMLASLGVFAFMCKLSSLIVLLWVVTVAGILVYEKRITCAQILRVGWFPAVILGVWTIKNIIISGCVFYPSVATCLDVPWAAKANAIENTAGVTAWARQPRASLRPLESWDWFGAWWWPYHRLFCGLTLFILITESVVYAGIGNKGKTYRHRIMLLALVFTLAALVFWFLKAPTLRFGSGVFIILPPIIIISLLGFRWSYYETRLVALRPVLIVMLAIKFGVFPNISVLRNVHIDFTLDMLPAPATTVIPDKNFGFRPEPPRDADQCWTVKYCAPDNRPIQREAYGYKYFSPDSQPEG